MPCIYPVNTRDDNDLKCFFNICFAQCLFLFVVMCICLAVVNCPSMHSKHTNVTRANSTCDEDFPNPTTPWAFATLSTFSIIFVIWRFFLSYKCQIKSCRPGTGFGSLR